MEEIRMRVWLFVLGRIRLRRWHEALRRDALRSALIPGTIVGLGPGLTAWAGALQGSAGLVTGPTAGLVTALVFMFSDSGADDASSAVPASSWRNDLVFGLVFGLLIGVILGITSGLTYANATIDFVWPSAVLGLGAGLGTGLATGIVFMLFSTRIWPTSLAFLQLSVLWHTPLRIMRFLEDARQRNGLRIIGPVYQFRHARLQDRLAGKDNLFAVTKTWKPEELAYMAPDVPGGLFIHHFQ